MAKYSVQYKHRDTNAISYAPAYRRFSTAIKQWMALSEAIRWRNKLQYVDSKWGQVVAVIPRDTWISVVYRRTKKITDAQKIACPYELLPSV